MNENKKLDEVKKPDTTAVEFLCRCKADYYPGE